MASWFVCWHRDISVTTRGRSQRSGPAHSDGDPVGIHKIPRDLQGRQTHLWFINNQVSLPVNRRGNGKLRIEWQLLTLTFIGSILKNPIYAGVCVYGRRKGKIVVSEGRIVKRTAPVLPPEECHTFFIRDHYEGYISFEEFEENRRKLQSNSLRWARDESVSVIRAAGHGLLGELVRWADPGRRCMCGSGAKAEQPPAIMSRGISRTEERTASVMEERRRTAVFRNSCGMTQIPKGCLFIRPLLDLR